MKTLANHQLIYDKDCPMCKVYSGAFVEAKMLDENGRQNYRDLSEQTKSLLNVNRARNEIALVNFAENKTYYGLDSLLIIIGNSFPILEKIGRISFIYWFFLKLYSLVSYNRKLIIPSKNDFLENACVPDFNLKYRLIFIISTIITSSYIFNLSFLKLGFQFSFNEILALIFGLIFWQILFLKDKRIENIANYIGNLVTILLAGSLLLMISSLLIPSIYLLPIVGILILVEHFRREKILRLSHLQSFSLLCYFAFIYYLLMIF